MCVNCGSDGIGRRDFMKFGAAGVVALGLGGAPAGRAPPKARRPRSPPTKRSPRSNRAMSAT